MLYDNATYDTKDFGIVMQIGKSLNAESSNEKQPRPFRTGCFFKSVVSAVRYFSSFTRVCEGDT